MILFGCFSVGIFLGHTTDTQAHETIIVTWNHCHHRFVPCRVVCRMWYVRQHGFFYQLSSFRNSMLIWLEPMLKVMRVCARHTFLFWDAFEPVVRFFLCCAYTCTAGILLRQHDVYDGIGAPQASSFDYSYDRVSLWISFVVTLHTDIVVISRSSCMFPHIFVHFSFHNLTPLLLLYVG